LQRHKNSRLFSEYPLLLYHSRLNEALAREASKASQGELESLTTQRARKLYEMNREVSKEIHLKKAFTRLSISEHGILYASLDFTHRIEQILLSSFTSRFPTFIVVIESKKKGTCYIGKKGKEAEKAKSPLSQVLKKLESQREKDSFLEGLCNEEELWEKYYGSQYIRERRNLKLLKKNMPKKFLQHNTTEQRIWKRSRDLRDFF